MRLIDDSSECNFLDNRKLGVKIRAHNRKVSAVLMSTRAKRTERATLTARAALVESAPMTAPVGEQIQCASLLPGVMHHSDTLP
jgi:hypothetical protein